MDIDLLINLGTFIFGGSIVSVVNLVINRKSEKRKREAEADHEQATADHEQATAELEKFRGWEAQIERMNNQIEFKDRRIEVLNQQLAEKEERFQRQMDEYRDQTRRLRECQDREYEANTEVKRLSEQLTLLTKENGELKNRRCHHKYCLDRKPQNEDTRQAIAEVKSGKRKTKKLTEVELMIEEDDEPLTDETDGNVRQDD